MTPAAPAAEVEAASLAIARDAGRAIAFAFRSRRLAVSYKDAAPEGRAPSSVVSEVDREIERFLRARIRARFPRHGVIGEELAEGEAGRPWLWVLDPVDGTANFVNGLPLFACSIGVLHRGVPVAGAVWCAATHRLRPGVYHGRRGGTLAFEGRPLRRPVHPGVQRHLAGLPARDAGQGRAVDHRVTGSAATECAWAAAGLLRYTLLRRTRIWDVAAGVALAWAAGLPVRERAEGGWRPFERFSAPEGGAAGATPTLRAWRGTLVLGEPDPEELPA
jgi:myo-inositol-1(or 4)-monophosphatase